VPGLRRPDFGEAPRGLFAEAAGFALDPPTADELFADRLRRSVRFELPRGAYATVLLRALGQGESE
jgi:tRNA(Glu) U13 pseudouridine synthase TruD